MPPVRLSTPVAVVAAVLLLGTLPAARCQEGGDAGMNEVITGIVYNKLQNLTGILNKDIGNDLQYCIKDRDKDWNTAFNFSSDLTFLNECIRQTKVLLCKIGALRSFSLDKLHYWRERASGMSSLAYFLAKDTIDLFNTVIKPIVYLSMFYFFTNPRSSIADNYVILVSLVYCVTGIAYWFAIFFQSGSAQLWSVLLPVVLTLVATQQNSSSTKFLANLCYTKWALEAFVISNAEMYPGVWLVTRCGSLAENGYNIGEWGLCIAILVLYGVTFRLIAFFCLITFWKKF